MVWFKSRKFQANGNQDKKVALTSGLLIDCRRIGTELGGEREREGRREEGGK